jgi:hypothetical protein
MKHHHCFKYLLINTLFLLSCSSTSIDFELIDNQTKDKIEKSHFKDYCESLDAEVIEESYVINASFIGDHKRAFELETSRSIKYENDALTISNGGSSIEDKEAMLKILSAKLADMPESSVEKKELEQFLSISKRPSDLNDLFKEYEPKDAIELITQQSNNFHFTSINEAHHSGLNRTFLKSLLLPLWNNGYRYLAIEALSKKDSLINKRGYPLTTSGYYFPEANLGNLAREAIEIGFTLIAYDEFFHTADNSLNKSRREKAQAENIYHQTLKKDSVGKVIIYSGHDHQITEGGDKQMGGWLKKISKKDILTIDQNIMVDKASVKKENDYYHYVKANYPLEKSTIFIHKESKEALVDPIHFIGGIKMQVYHPPYSYINERPKWMLTDKNQLYVLPQEIRDSFDSCLMEFRPIDETINSTPVDKFVINKTKKAILPLGQFFARVINCDNKVVARYKVAVRK